MLKHSGMDASKHSNKKSYEKRKNCQAETDFAAKEQEGVVSFSREVDELCLETGFLDKSSTRALSHDRRM